MRKNYFRLQWEVTGLGFMVFWLVGFMIVRSIRYFASREFLGTGTTELLVRVGILVSLGFYFAFSMFWILGRRKRLLICPDCGEVMSMGEVKAMVRKDVFHHGCGKSGELGRKG